MQPEFKNLPEKNILPKFLLCSPQETSEPLSSSLWALRYQYFQAHWSSWSQESFPSLKGGSCVSPSHTSHLPWRSALTLTGSLGYPLMESLGDSQWWPQVEHAGNSEGQESGIPRKKRPDVPWQLYLPSTLSSPSSVEQLGATPSPCSLVSSTVSRRNKQRGTGSWGRGTKQPESLQWTDRIVLTNRWC